MPHISNKLLKRLREDELLQFSIAKGMNKKFRTVERWLRENNKLLASTAVVLIIQKETGLSEEEILKSDPVNIPTLKVKKPVTVSQ